MEWWAPAKPSGPTFTLGTVRSLRTYVLHASPTFTAAARLFITLFDATLTSPEHAGHGWEGYYFAENGHSSWYDIGKAIGRVLVDLGIAKDAEPTPFSVEELEKYWGHVVRPPR